MASKVTVSEKKIEKARGNSKSPEKKPSKPVADKKGPAPVKSDVSKSQTKPQRASTIVEKLGGAKSAAPVKKNTVVTAEERKGRSASKGPSQDKSAKAGSKSMSLRRSATEPKAKSKSSSGPQVGSKRLAAKSATKLVSKLAPSQKATSAKAAAATKKPKRK